MRNDNFSVMFKMLRKIRSKLVKCNSKMWFLKSCRVMGLVPVTLQPRVQDPAAHQEGYTTTKAAAWKRAQGRAGRRLLVEASQREEARREELQLEERREMRRNEQLLSDEEWLALISRVESLARSLTRMKRREHGVKLVGLLVREQRAVPAWLDRSSGSILESTDTMTGEQEAGGEEQEAGGQEQEAGGQEQEEVVTSTPLRPRQNHRPGPGEIHDFVAMARRETEEIERVRLERRWEREHSGAVGATVSQEGVEEGEGEHEAIQSRDL